MLHAQFLNNNFFSATLLGGGFLGLLAYFRGIPARLYHFVLDRITVTVHFNSTDKMYFYLQKWVASQTKFDRFQKKYNVMSMKLPRGNTVNATPDDDESITAYSGAKEEKNAKPPKFIFAPHPGNYFIRQQGKWMHLGCHRNDPTESKSGGSQLFIYETISLSYFGRSLKAANAFLDEVMALYESEKDSAVYVHTPHSTNGYWIQRNKLYHRKLESIICRDNHIITLVNDLKDFKSPETEKWYIDMGIPYHRGYLFEGMPGTGKTSTILTLASHFNMGVYFLNIGPDMSDADFLGLVGEIDDDSILILEDIDYLFDANREKKKEMRISFSSMLNALDGFCAKHGSIVILTTNHLDQLNSALVRKGRVDVSITFRLCNVDQIRRFFLKFYPGKEEEAQHFAAHFPNDSFAPVDIQNYLLETKTMDNALAGAYKFSHRIGDNNERQESKTAA